MSNPVHVVGVVEHLATPTGWDDNTDMSLLLAMRTTFTEGLYLLRTDPQRRQEVLTAALAALVDAQELGADPVTPTR